ncbi:MAG: site-2 protease family protein, partial [Planctomycetota bacterium]
NKPVGVRMAVIAAGVLFNAISALMIFVIVFLIGIKLPPPIIGGVDPDSPAAKVGLKPGDEIIEIDGKTRDLDFSNILVAAALSGKDEKVSMKVKRGQEILDFTIASEEREGSDIRLFGIEQARSLVVGKVRDSSVLRDQTGLLPGDRIVTVNGEDVSAYWELEKVMTNTVVPEVHLKAERTDSATKQAEAVESKLIKLSLYLANGRAESDFSNIYSMVPRLRIASVTEKPPGIRGKIARLLDRIGLMEVESKPDLKSGDVILAIGSLENPTYKEFRQVTTEYEGKKLPIRVLRTTDESEEVVTVDVVPKRTDDGKHVVIGLLLIPGFDAMHPVVAKTVTTEAGVPALGIPPGATVTAVDTAPVSDFYDIIREVYARSGKPVRIHYRLDDGETGAVSLNADGAEDPIILNKTLSEFVPFKDLKRLYKADNPAEAVAMGYRKTIMFIAQTYVTLRRLISGLVSPKSLMGPVGILAVSYTIVTDQPLINYAYLLGLISACIAVVNFLPLPPFDGGHIVLLAIEKIKGSVLSERVQGAVAYAGVVLVIALFLYLTFNDVLNMFLR